MWRLEILQNTKLNILALPERDLENERDQVKLGVMVFAPSGRRSSGIEVPGWRSARREYGRSSAKCAQR